MPGALADVPRCSQLAEVSVLILREAGADRERADRRRHGGEIDRAGGWCGRRRLRAAEEQQRPRDVRRLRGLCNEQQKAAWV